MNTICRTPWIQRDQSLHPSRTQSLVPDQDQSLTNLDTVAHSKDEMEILLHKSDKKVVILIWELDEITDTIVLFLFVFSRPTLSYVN